MYGEGPGEAFEGMTTLAALAGVTSRIRLGLLVAGVTYRHPSVFAAQALTIDHASHGRLELSLGAAWFEQEHDALGIPFPPTPARFDLLEDALEIVQRLFTGNVVSYDGRSVSLHDAQLRPVPVQQPHPPIWIGGNSGQARQRVADRGDGWCPFAAPAGLAQTARTTALDTPELLAEAIDDLRARLDAAGRDPATVDICFSNTAGGDPASDAFDADAHLEGVERLAALGVTWIQTGLPGDSLERALDVAQRYGEQIIARC
jgi:probable F420-dependent oxidoreductase